MNEQNEMINRLTFENYIWVIYIFIAITDNDKEKDKLAKDIFTISLIITVIIYLYFFSRNYKDYQGHKNSKAYELRFLGSILMISGILCFLYFQIKTSYSSDTVSSI